MSEPHFKFRPQDYVVVIFNDLMYRGRVLRCIYDGGANIYRIQYSDDKGDLKSDEFFEDEIEARVK